MKKSKHQHLLVLQRIKHLFKQARAVFGIHPERSHRYVQLARTLAMKARIPIPKSLKRHYCKHCYKYFQPGTNCRVRTGKSQVIYSCFSCKKYTRIPYGKKLKKTKQTTT